MILEEILEEILDAVLVDLVVREDLMVLVDMIMVLAILIMVLVILIMVLEIMIIVLHVILMMVHVILIIAHVILIMVLVDIIMVLVDIIMAHVILIMVLEIMTIVLLVILIMVLVVIIMVLIVSEIEVAPIEDNTHFVKVLGIEVLVKEEILITEITIIITVLLEIIIEKSNEDKENSATAVYVSNLPFSVDEASLAKIFYKYKVKTTHIVQSMNGRSRGYGFVEFETNEDQSSAIKEMNEAEVKGSDDNVRKITVKVALVDKQKVETTTTSETKD